MWLSIKRAFILVSITFCLTLLLPGCPVEAEIEYIAEIQSNTTWILRYGGQVYSGNGNDFVSLPPNTEEQTYQLPICVTLKKETANGFLRARVSADGISVLGSHDGDWSTTTERFGNLYVCSAGTDE